MRGDVLRISDSQERHKKVHSLTLSSDRMSKEAVCSEQLAPPGPPPAPALENVGPQGLQSQINKRFVKVKCIHILGKSSSPN